MMKATLRKLLFFLLPTFALAAFGGQDPASMLSGRS